MSLELVYSHTKPLSIDIPCPLQTNLSGCSTKISSSNKSFKNIDLTSVWCNVLLCSKDHQHPYSFHPRNRKMLQIFGSNTTCWVQACPNSIIVRYCSYRPLWAKAGLIFFQITPKMSRTSGVYWPLTFKRIILYLDAELVFLTTQQIQLKIQKLQITLKS